jgi:hypothetical protein
MKGTAVLIGVGLALVCAAVAIALYLVAFKGPPAWASLVFDGTLAVCFALGLLAGLWYVSSRQRRFRLQSVVREGGGSSVGRAPIGVVAESMTRSFWGGVFACCCRMTHYDDIYEVDAGSGDPEGGSHPTFTLRVALCCFRGGPGRPNNCCGGTCCKSELVMDILDPNQDDALVGSVRKIYAPGRGCNALCRMCQRYSNYVVIFPPKATKRQRQLLLAGLLHVDYEHFERKGGDK